MVLEILKMTIRTVIAGKIGDQKKSLRQKELELEKERNQIEDLKMITVKETKIDSDERKRRKVPLNIAFDTMNGKIEQLWKKTMKTENLKAKQSGLNTVRSQIRSS
jgi:hypothetical protein